jgi:hypothetical protein
MEPDSVPLQRFWLDRLRKEIEERRPFAVLGSKYRGDNWYDFIRDLEIPLLNHFNGNAIYNISHPLMNLMLGQLEIEADQMYNFIPFDLRMSQVKNLKIAIERLFINPPFVISHVTSLFFFFFFVRCGPRVPWVL